MATSISNGESGLSVRNKLNDIWHSLDLNEIAATISDTAVDVFVYDTRKDSDGGAWRKRTQHTSWYNETLNTSTRGSRKEFPAVAVIVVETAQVTIYDGDDPDLPMWKSIGVSGDSYYTDQSAILGSGGDVTSVSALNGLLSIGSNTGASGTTSMNGLTRINLIADYVYGTNATYTYKWLGSLGDTATQAYWTSLGTGTVIVNLNVNDVAMTVLPNAPIDATTGLPVPTIAVATDGGVSVIKNDGTVVDSTATTEFANIAFAGNDMWVTDKAFADEIRYYGNVSGLADGFTHDFTYWGGSVTTSSNTGLPQPWWDNSSSLYDEFAVTDYGIAARQHSNGFFALNPDATHKNGLGAYIASGYNTGWMNGDIKLATLSDKYNASEPNVTGSDIVTGDNSTFTSSVGSWSANAGSIAAVSGELEVTSGGANRGRANLAFPTTVGKTYTLSVYGRDGTTTTFAHLGTSLGDASLAGNWILGSGSGTTHSVTFTATTTTTWIQLGAISTTAGTTVYYDNVVVRLAEEDRSVNGNGLQVFGTVTKSAVATGADLVAYSGFSGSNYLEQPYNSDLDFGTGDFCYMGWFKTSSNGITMFERCASPRSGNGMTVYMDGTGKPLWYKIVSGTPTIVVTPTAAYNNNTWVHFAAIRQNGVVSLYFNGQKDGSASDSTDMTNSSAIFRLGANATGTSGWTGSLALWRISATVPSPEQIKKIYEDEKVLFQDGAQATLYGSSDAVTALAYDDSTELLHVGTSAGRSVFQGLRRVDNTTDAVGATISASNGLVAED